MYAVICVREGRETVRAGFETREQADIWSAKADKACPGWIYRTVPMIFVTMSRGEMEGGN